MLASRTGGDQVLGSNTQPRALLSAGGTESPEGEPVSRHQGSATKGNVPKNLQLRKQTKEHFRISIMNICRERRRVVKEMIHFIPRITDSIYKQAAQRIQLKDALASGGTAAGRPCPTGQPQPHEWLSPRHEGSSGLSCAARVMSVPDFENLEQRRRRRIS